MSKYFDDGICRYLFTPYDEGADTTEGFYTVERCPRQMTDMVLPDEINGSPVTAISDLAFNYKTLMRRIMLPKDITDIGALAFNGCTMLERIVIPPKVKRIGKDAFAGCTAIRVMVIPPSVEDIGEGAFENCDALEKIYVAKDSYAHKWIAKEFYGADISEVGKLDMLFEKIVFYSPETDGASEFFSPSYDFDTEQVEGGVKITLYSGSEEAVRIPPYIDSKPVVAIGSEIFSGCIRVQSVHIPETVEDISTYAFDLAPVLGRISVNSANPHFSSEGGVLFNKDKDALVRCPEGLPTSKYTVPEGVLSIADDAFHCCGALEFIDLPSTLEFIGDRCFAECYSLRKLVLPPTLEEFGEGAFAYCAALKEITIPPFLQYVGMNSMHGCDALTSVYALPTSRFSVILEEIPEAQGHLKMPPAEYFAQCLPLAFKEMEENGTNVADVKKWLVEMLHKNGVDPSYLSNITGVPAFAEILELDEDEDGNGDDSDDSYDTEMKSDDGQKKDKAEASEAAKSHTEPPKKPDSAKEPDKKMPKGNTASVTFITNGADIADLLSKLHLNGGELETDDPVDFLSSILERFSDGELEYPTSDRRPSQRAQAKKEEPQDPLKTVTDEEFDEFLAKYDRLIEKTDATLRLAKANKESDGD